MTYTTAHGNGGSLTHWVRPRIEPEFSWMLVGFINRWATTGIPPVFFKLQVPDPSLSLSHNSFVRILGCFSHGISYRLTFADHIIMVQFNMSLLPVFLINWGLELEVWFKSSFISLYFLQKYFTEGELPSKVTQSMVFSLFFFFFFFWTSAKLWISFIYPQLIRIVTWRYSNAP